MEARSIAQVHVDAVRERRAELKGLERNLTDFIKRCDAPQPRNSSSWFLPIPRGHRQAYWTLLEDHRSCGEPRGRLPCQYCMAHTASSALHFGEPSLRTVEEEPIEAGEMYFARGGWTVGMHS